MKKGAIVTGGSLGFGAALVDRLLGLNANWRIVILDLNPPPLTTTAAAGVSFLKCDVSNASEFNVRFMEALQMLDNQLDLLVNNAGNAEDARTLDERPEEEWVRLIRIHFHAVVRGTSLALKHGSHGCVVVNTSSLSALFPFGSAPVYSASKAAVASFSQAMAPTMRKKGMRIVAICPAFSPTAIIKDIQDLDVVTKNLVPVSQVVSAFIRAILDTTLNGHVIVVKPGLTSVLRTIDASKI